VTEVSTRNFGYLIAYILPGVVTLAGVSRYSETVRSWFGAAPTGAPTVGGFLFLTLGSVAAGMVVSTVRWMFLDGLHHHTGIQEGHWDFSALEANYTAFEGAVENHYRYYQFYGNMLVAVLVTAFTQWSVWLAFFGDGCHATVAVLVLIALFFVASRDTLAKYYARSAELLYSNALERSKIMTNGWHNEEPLSAKEKVAKNRSTKKGGKRNAADRKSSAAVVRQQQK
jgi:hypothetical protein